MNHTSSSGAAMSVIAATVVSRSGRVSTVFSVRVSPLASIIRISAMRGLFKSRLTFTTSTSRSAGFHCMCNGSHAFFTPK